jgi:hypothetical protein
LGSSTFRRQPGAPARELGRITSPTGKAAQRCKWFKWFKTRP